MSEVDRTARVRDENGVVVCACGCGAPTGPASWTTRRLGLVRGEPTRYVRGHNSRQYPPVNEDNYHEEDHGYETPCHVWQGGTDRNGYGQISYYIDGRVVTRLAHIVAWEKENGPVPPGLELDHLCEIKPCRRPSHLEPVTHAVNMQRAYAARAVRLLSVAPHPQAVDAGCAGHTR